MVQTRAVTESFDLYPTDVGTPSYGINAVWQGSASAIVAGRFAGSQAARVGSWNNPGIYRGIPQTDELAWGFAMKAVSGVMDAYPIAKFRDRNLITQFTLSVGPLGVLRLNLGDNVGANIVAQSDFPVIVLGTWHYVEMEYFLHDSAGFCRVYLDGVLVPGLSYVGDTKATTDIAIGAVNFAGADARQIDFDDMYVEINGSVRVGEGRMDVLLPNADISQTGFTPSTGSTLFGVIDEKPANITDWVSANAAASVFRVGLTDLVYAPEFIYGVQLESLASKTEAGTRILRNRLWGATGDFSGADKAQTLNTYLWSRDWFPREPDENAPWSSNKLNAIHAGVEIVT